MTPILVKSVIRLSLFLVTLDGLSAQKESINPEGCGVSFFKTMIVNGTEVKETQYPWVVFLSLLFADGRGRTCGGSIITKRHILTAAHCLLLENMPAKIVDVLYGSVDRRRGKKVGASKMLIHKDYDHSKTKNDIALLEVKYPFTFGKEVKPICLEMAPMPIVDKDAVIAGWGSYYVGGDGFDILRHTTVTIYPDDICAMMYSKNSYSAGLQCCGRKRGKGMCEGDSGGPLMIRTGVGRFQQVGISSYVEDVCAGKYPDVHTRVSGYANWLTRGVASSAGYTPLLTPKP